MELLDLALGRKLANKEQRKRKLGWLEAVPAMGLDGLGSASYGPEAALNILAPLGAASLSWIGWVMAPVLVLLALLYLSYRQTIVAYQTNGGAYVVAKVNLGSRASVLAAAALMTDYVLNVAVGISAGIGALTSSAPSLQPYTLWLCLAVLALVTLVNLRGTGEAGLLFALPTYLFILCFLGILGYGVVRAAMLGGAAHPFAPPAPIRNASESVSLWLLLRAFAAGCTAMTGVEAVSNSVGAFKPPVVRRAHVTLTIICAALGLLLAAVATCAREYHVAAMAQSEPGYQSVLSQLAGAIVGRGFVYYVAMGSLLIVLALSANTSFVGFPRLARLVAEDSFLPRPFAAPGRRLVYSLGIVFLSLAAGALLICFGGITDRLIPLFAIGAFVTFAMSQIGMVAHWRKQMHGNVSRLAVNAIGAAATVVATIIIVTTKFADGAWIVLLAIPLIYTTMIGIRRYYDHLDAMIRADSPTIRMEETEPPTVLVLIEDRSRMSDRALSFAMTLSPDVIAVHLLNLLGPDHDESVRALHEKWEKDVVAPLASIGLQPPRLMVLPAPQREMHRPLLRFIDKLDADTPGRSVAVMIPELVLTRWWERLFHSRRAERIRAALIKDGRPRLKVIIAPWRAET